MIRRGGVIVVIVWANILYGVSYYAYENKQVGSWIFFN